ncbi:MAG: PspA/IM30 family protein [Desulfobacterales bacterium]|nr:PspA/IM30 family protein [Desulfobacterales bacterium]
MALLTRIIRLFKADIHGVMDQIEDQGLLLKQHLRDMEASLVQKETKLKKMGFAMDQAQQAYKKGKKETDNLELDLEVAIKKDKDDIARMLIKKLKPLTRIQSERCSHIDLLNHEIVQFKENLDQQRLQYEQLKQKATEYFYRIEKQNWENTWSAMPTGLSVNDLSEEEVELELLQRKDAIKGGAES